MRPLNGVGRAMEKGYLSTGKYFSGAWDPAHTFGDLGSTAKKASGKKIRDLGRSGHYF